MDSGNFSEVETRDICGEQIFYKMDHTKSASAEPMLPSTVSALGGSGFSALAVSSDGMTVAAATDDFINVYPISSIWLPSMSLKIPTGVSDSNFEVQNSVCNRTDCDDISSTPYTGAVCERGSRSHSRHHVKAEGTVHSLYFHGDEDEYLIGIGPNMLLLYDLMEASLDPLIALDMRCFGMYSDDLDEGSEQSVSVLRINRNTAFCKGYGKLLSSIELVVSVKPYIPTFYRVLFNETEDWSIIDCNSTCPIIPQESIDDDVPYFLYNHNHHFINESWASSDAHSDSESDSAKVRKVEDDLSDTQEGGEIDNGTNDTASQISSSGAPYDNIDSFKETKEDNSNDTIDGNFFYPFTLLEELLKYDDDDILDAVKQNIRMDGFPGHDSGASSHTNSRSLKFSGIIKDEDGLPDDSGAISGSADDIEIGIQAVNGSPDSCNNPNNPHSCDCLCPSGTLNLEFNEEYLYSSMVPMSSLVLIKLTLLNNYSIRWCVKEPYIYSRTSSVLNAVILSDLELITQGGYVHSIISRDCDNMFTVISSDRFFLLRYTLTLPETTDDPPSCSDGSSSLSFPSEKLETGTEIPLDVNRGGRTISNCDKIGKLDSQGVTCLIERNKKNSTLQEKGLFQLGQSGGDVMPPSLERISDSSYRISYNDDQHVYDLEMKYTHYDPVLKVRYCTGCFNKYSDDGYFVICTNYASHFRLHFFDLASQSSVDAVRLILDVSKCKGLTIVAWVSGNKLVGLTKLNGELYLLEPKFKRNWVGLVPNFNYIDSNVELIEEEDIFDDSEADETICIKPSPRENNASRRSPACNKLKRNRRTMSNSGTIRGVRETAGCKVYPTHSERLSQIVSNRGYRRKIYNKIYNYGSGIDSIRKYPFYHIGFSVTGGEWPSFHDSQSADKLSDENIIQHNDNQNLLKLYHQKVNYTK